MVKDALEGRGVRVWWQEEIQSGKEWHRELDRALAEAACIVVLWSEHALQSSWVRHEASQALVRDVYAPARIAVTEIPSPFDRIQTADLLNWTGNPDDPGFCNLLARVEQLLPEPLSSVQRAWRWVHRRRVTLAAAVIAVAVVAILIQQARIVADQSREKERIAAEQRKLALDLERSLHPINDLEVSAWFEVPDGSPHWRRFTQRLVETLRIPESVRGNEDLPPEVARHGIRLRINQTVGIPRTSPFWPDSLREWNEYNAINFSALQLRFFVEHVPPDSISAVEFGFGPRKADLEIGSTIPRDSLELRFDAKTRRVGVYYSEFPVVRLWDTNGRIVSVPDLVRSQLIITPQALLFDDGTGRLRLPAFEPTRADLRLQALLIKVSGREFWLHGPSLIRQVSPSGVTYYIGRLQEDNRR
jgi:hypothetical protein